MFRGALLAGGALASLLLLVAAPGAAQVAFEEKAKDLGGAPRGTPLKHYFRFTNRYNQELHVSGVRVSCGKCTSAAVTKTTLAPGESADLIVNVDTLQFIGSRSFYVYVTFDRPVFEEAVVSINAASREDLMISPATLAYGIVRMGAAPTAETTVEYRGGLQNWTITGVANDNGYIQPELKEVSRQFGLVAYKVKVKLREDCPPGSWHADLWLTTNDPASPRIRVPLTVEIQGALTAAPQSVELGSVAKGSQLERKIVVRGVEPFTITKIEGLDPSIEITGQSKDPAKVQVLKLKYSAGQDPGEFSKRLRIITDLKKDNEVQVTLRGSQSP